MQDVCLDGYHYPDHGSEILYCCTYSTCCLGFGLRELERAQERSRRIHDDEVFRNLNNILSYLLSSSDYSYIPSLAPDKCYQRMFFLP
jgi:hypothetical protein